MTATNKNGDISLRVLQGLFFLVIAVYGVVKGFDGSLLGWIAGAFGLVSSFFSLKGSASTAGRDVGHRHTVLLLVFSVGIFAQAMLLLDTLFD